MTPGLKFSFAARAAANSAGRASAEQRISCRARSRELGRPGCRSASFSEHDEVCFGAAVLRAVAVTVLRFRGRADASNHTTADSACFGCPTFLRRSDIDKVVVYGHNFTDVLADLPSLARNLISLPAFRVRHPGPV